MREHRYCESCGSSRFVLAEVFAVANSSGDHEVAVWRCHGCGGLAEEESAAPSWVVEVRADARVA